MMDQVEASVDLDVTAMTASLQVAKANFAHVTFRGMAETYDVGKDVMCSYVIGAALEPTARDWVGLYKVGWRSPDNYICYEWSPMPANYVAGSEVENHVVFPASKLPSDDGEFYQFCYVTSKSSVRGASSPFQFRKSVSFSSTSLDDLIEIEDENGELLIVRSKTAFLDEQLKKANDMCAQLKQDVQLLENEKDLLILNKQDVQMKLQRQKEEDNVLRQQIEESKSVVLCLNDKISDLQTTVASQQEKMMHTIQEKSELQSRVIESERNLAELQETNKALTTDHDALLGQVKSLENEKSLYQSHYSSSENTIQSHMQKNEELRALLADEEAKSRQMAERIEVIEKELAARHDELHRNLAEMSQDKEQILVLEGHLSEAKTEIVVQQKKVEASGEQLAAILEACQKLSTDLEVTKTESEGLKIQLRNLMAANKAEIEKATRAIDELEASLASEKKEKVSLVGEVSSLRQQLDEVAGLVGTDSALYAMQAAHSSLKERYFRMEKQVAKQQAMLEQAAVCKQELEEVITNQKREIVLLKERLLMGQETYKEKFVECQALQDRLARRQMAKVPAATTAERQDTTDAAATNTDSMTVTAELQQQMREVNTELDRRANLLRRSEQRVLEETQARLTAERHATELEVELSVVKRMLADAIHGPPENGNLPRTIMSNDQLHSVPELICLQEPATRAAAAPNSQQAPVVAAPPRPLLPPSITQRVFPGPMTSNDATADTAADCHVELQTSSGVGNVSRPPSSMLNDVHSCVVCDVEFRVGMSSDDKLRHIDLHFVQGECPFCAQTYAVADLNDHVQLHHTVNN